MSRRVRAGFCSAIMAAAPSGAWAAAQSFVGTLADENDVAFIPFTLTAAEGFSAQSYGFGGTSAAPGGVDAAGAVIAPGGAETVLSLFSGAGATASFVASTYAAGPYACPPANGASGCLDPQLTLTLAAGAYTLAVSDYANISYAENDGFGTLGDGFTGFGSPDSLHSGAYAVDLALGAGGSGGGGGTSVPAPGTTAILLGMLALPAARLRLLKDGPR